MNEKGLLLAISCVALSFGTLAQNKPSTDETKLRTPDLKGEYLGQKKPGLTPELFAPNFISTEYSETDPFFHPNGKEFYYTMEGENGYMNIIVSKLEDGKWTNPKPLPIPNKESFGTAITGGGSNLYFASIDLISENDSRTEYNLWVMEREGDGWGNPKPLGPGINTPDALEMLPSIADDGTLYFKRFSFEDDTEKIYYAERENGQYMEAKLFEAEFNLKYNIEDPFMSPDESFVTFTAKISDRPRPYISFKDDLGEWLVNPEGHGWYLRRCNIP